MTPTGLHLSLAHSGGGSPLPSRRPVGVDIERALRQRDLLGLASALYAPAFVRCWPRKTIGAPPALLSALDPDEARAKALGTGLQPKALREHGWDRAADVAADGWTRNLADGWLALSLPSASAADPDALVGPARGRRVWLALERRRAGARVSALAAADTLCRCP